MIYIQILVEEEEDTSEGLKRNGVAKGDLGGSLRKQKAYLGLEDDGH